MMSLVISLISWLNAVFNVLFDSVRPQIEFLGPWPYMILNAILFGILALIVIKVTSNQSAIRRLRDRIKADLFAPIIFKDNLHVVFQSQVRIAIHAFLLLVHSVVPMMVMAIPFILFAGQMGLWYQHRPLEVGEEVVLTVQLDSPSTEPMSLVALESSEDIFTTVGPVRVPSKRRVYWKIQATREGTYHLTCQVDGQSVTKELAVGGGFMAVSCNRSVANLVDLLKHPAETPLDRNSPIQWINICYPTQSSRLIGSDTWIYTFIVISMITAFLCKPFFNVQF